MSKRMLVTYFSATGTTREVAERLAHAIGADLKEIEPAEPYTAADLDWRDSGSRTSVEHRDRAMRPALKTPIGVNGYDVVFVGYPLWWETAPRVVRTFLESEDWADKTIVTFATSGSSTRGADGVQLHDSAPAAHWVPGRRVGANESEAKLAKWVEGLAL
ncbi:flavodoxin [Bifidobacterium vespertilionis]|uniref:Flavodoxin n=1 Tax=Bifidobacterium vespertilionis TaxID=2562524 RepID=A0A5J5DUM8_9BIFI|nr:flavodoxin [Bifidobacterium vespertilionis]KAA8820072.1 flavodoxin [Bifidobacterium vespertilionis]KAA8822227.1 flavodoxin [Bifidobacterium vespertilionis]